MKSLKNLLIWLAVKVFGIKPFEKVSYRFVNEPNSKNIVAMLELPEFQWFVAECKNMAIKRIRLAKSAEDRNTAAIGMNAIDIMEFLKGQLIEKFYTEEHVGSQILSMDNEKMVEEYERAHGEILIKDAA